MEVVNTRIIPTWLYGVKDYLAIAILLAGPWIFGFDDNKAATYVFVGVGIVGLLHTILTKFELGLFKVLPMHMHLMMDAGAGLFLIASPWLFGFADRVYIPHVAMGVMELIVVMFAHRYPREKHAGSNTLRAGQEGELAAKGHQPCSADEGVGGWAHLRVSQNNWRHRPLKGSSAAAL